MQVLTSKPAVWRNSRFRFLEGAAAERALQLVTAAVIVLGFWLRARGFLYSTMSLWLGDEASWAIRLMEKPLLCRRSHSDPSASWRSRRSFRAAPVPLGDDSSFDAVVRWHGELVHGVAAGCVTCSVRKPLVCCSCPSWPCILGRSISRRNSNPIRWVLAIHMALLLLVLRYSHGGKTRDLRSAPWPSPRSSRCCSRKTSCSLTPVSSWCSSSKSFPSASLPPRSCHHIGCRALTLSACWSSRASMFFMWSRMEHGKDPRSTGGRSTTSSTWPRRARQTGRTGRRGVSHKSRLCRALGGISAGRRAWRKSGSRSCVRSRQHSSGPCCTRPG